MKKRVLVFGGNRFFGKLTVQNLVNSGCKVYVVNRGNLENVEGTIHLKCDRNDKQFLNSLLDDLQVDCIFDNSCYNPQQLQITFDVLEENNIDVNHYIFTSTSAVYFDTVTQNIDESYLGKNNIQHNAFPHDVVDYGLKKLECEELLKKSRYNYTVFRFPNVFGKADFRRKFDFFISRAKNNKTIFQEADVEKTSIIFDVEAAEIIANAVCSEIYFNKILNVSNPSGLEINKIYDLFSNKIGSALNIRYIEAKTMYKYVYSRPFVWSPILNTGEFNNCHNKNIFLEPYKVISEIIDMSLSDSEWNDIYRDVNSELEELERSGYRSLIK